MLYLIACGAFCATLLGGLLALWLEERRHVVLGFSAGAVIAVAFFDLLPEAIELGEGVHSPSLLLTTSAIGFLGYLVLDRLIALGGHHHASTNPANARRGSLGAGSLSVHSFLDGIAIGFAFRASPSVGLVVAAAVLTHDFSDGINTLSIVVKNGGSRRSALLWLLVDALAPVIGIGATMIVHLPARSLDVILALFAGFFFYIGASDLIPESHRSHPKFATTVATVIGAGVLYLAVRFAQ